MNFDFYQVLFSRLQCSTIGANGLVCSGKGKCKGITLSRSTLQNQIFTNSSSQGMVPEREMELANVTEDFQEKNVINAPLDSINRIPMTTMSLNVQHVIKVKSVKYVLVIIFLRNYLFLFQLVLISVLVLNLQIACNARKVMFYTPNLAATTVK